MNVFYKWSVERGTEFDGSVVLLRLMEVRHFPGRRK